MINIFYLWLARKILPKRLVYFCEIQIGAEATTGKYSNTIVPKVEFTEAIRRYGEKYWIS